MKIGDSEKKIKIEILRYKKEILKELYNQLSDNQKERFNKIFKSMPTSPCIDDMNSISEFHIDSAINLCERTLCNTVNLRDNKINEILKDG